MKPRGNWLFPLSLACILGGVSFWLDSISETPTEEAVLNPNEPRYRINDISGARFNENGQLNETVTAKSVWQLPNQKVIFITQPKMTMYHDGKPLYNVSAADAQYHTNSREVWFDHQVILTKQATAGEAEGQLETDHLEVNTKTQTAKTDVAVNYHYGLSHGKAVGFEYNRERGFLNLSSRVKTTIYEPKP
ncbi:LPS export ABC transporter periplasmic protein LptC [Stenoxybacter acetivorans]|uniref:LPS export ABC transporter periplasmic protein LptC n=1 Tax=Stenoxybacter acetivorans TaxID=422441 RepID=UPI00056CD96A|nr:LPS export ABC transporter periplasmic protein LptC [Stenoxybacter acetivorans]